MLQSRKGVDPKKLKVPEVVNGDPRTTFIPCSPSGRIYPWLHDYDVDGGETIPFCKPLYLGVVSNITVNSTNLY